MKINTTRFGEIEIEDEEIITFAHGVPGFEEEKNFVIIPYDENSPFFFLQSLQSKELAFLLINPFSFYKEYSVELDDAVVDELEIADENDVVVYSIITMHGSEVKKMTANLLAPLVINVKNRKAKQFVLEGTKFTTKYDIFAQADEGGK